MTAVPNIMVTVTTPDNLKTNDAKVSHQPKAEPNSSSQRSPGPAAAIPVSPAVSLSVQQPPGPAKTTKQTPQTTSAALVATDQYSSTAVSLHNTPPTISPAPVNHVIIGTAVPPIHLPALVDQGSSSSNGSTTNCRLVDNGSGQQSLRCSKVISGPARNRVVAVSISADNTAKPAAAPVASRLKSAETLDPATDSASPAVSIMPAAAPSPSLAGVDLVSPPPAVKHTITIIHDPEVTSSGELTTKFFKRLNVDGVQASRT